MNISAISSTIADVSSSERNFIANSPAWKKKENTISLGNNIVLGRERGRILLLPRNYVDGINRNGSNFGGGAEESDLQWGCESSYGNILISNLDHLKQCTFYSGSNSSRI